MAIAKDSAKNTKSKDTTITKDSAKKDPVKKDSAKNDPVKKDSVKEPAKISVTKVSEPTIAKDGHSVVIEYVGTFDNGEVFDDSRKHGPINFTIGAGQVIRGFNDAVIGMKKNEKKKIHVTKENAYGDSNPQLIHKVPLSKLAPEIKDKVKVGGFLVMQAPTGQHIPAKVQAITKDAIILDLNHPLAGKELNFEITLLNISAEPPKHMHNHDKDGKCEDCGDECGDDCECK